MIRYVTGDEGDTFSPYVNAWDLLWLGHCGDDVDYHKGNIAARSDVTLPETPLYRDVYGGFSYFPPQLRLVHSSVWPVCIFAYAVRRDAALKIYGLSKGGTENIITVDI